MTRLIAATLLLSAPTLALCQDFHGYPCTEDCTGHKAGYEWAEDRGISDPADCGGNSKSFIEGCRAYAEELMDEEQTQAATIMEDSGDDGE